MHFNVSQWADAWVADHPDQEVICPYRIFDPATGSSIHGVREFNDDEGWVRVLCRDPYLSIPGRPRWAFSEDHDDVITQIIHIPFQVVPYYDGIDDLPRIYIDNLEFRDGKPVGDWLPLSQPYQRQP